MKTLTIIFIFILCVFLSSCANNKSDTAIPIEDSSTNDSVVAENNSTSTATEVNSVNDSATAENKEAYESTIEPIIVTSELLRTGEFFTATQMEILQAQALDWRSATAGVSSSHRIFAIDSPDVSDQQIFISTGQREHGVYERLQIQMPDGVQARIIHAFSGAGSGEVNFAFRMVTDDSEWIEIFFFYGFLCDDGEYHYRWENARREMFHPENFGLTVQWLSELSPDELPLSD